MLIDTHHKHRGILAGGWDNDFLSTPLINKPPNFIQSVQVNNERHSSYLKWKATHTGKEITTTRTCPSIKAVARCSLFYITISKKHRNLRHSHKNDVEKEYNYADTNQQSKNKLNKISGSEVQLLCNGISNSQNHNFYWKNSIAVKCIPCVSASCHGIKSQAVSLSSE